MPLYRLRNHSPRVDPSAWIAPSAELIGRVCVGPRTSIWFGAVLRGDINEIRIGAESNLQDHVTVHLSNDLPTLLGERVTVGHRALLHACIIGSDVLVGMGAIVMDGAEVGTRSIVGAGALITSGTIVPPGSLVLGSPAKVVRELSAEEQAGLPRWAEAYTNKLALYDEHCHRLPSSAPR